MECKTDECDEYMSSDEVAACLVKIYAEYTNRKSNGICYHDDKYAKAVGIAIRMLSD